MTDPVLPTTELGGPVELHDGSRVRVRQGHSSDKELLLRGFERMSPESRYRRFLAAMPELSDEKVRYLTEIDHHDHEAIAAFDGETGEGIGIARYVRNPQRPDVAEVSVAVIDDWQDKGLGTILLEVLGSRARTAGINTFTALILATNDHMLHVLEALGSVRIVDRERGTVEIEVPIPQTGPSPQIRRLLGVVARNDLVVVPPADPDTPRLAPDA